MFRFELDIFDDLSQRSDTARALVAVDRLPDPEPAFSEQIIDGDIAHGQAVEVVDIDDEIVAMHMTTGGNQRGNGVYQLMNYEAGTFFSGPDPIDANLPSVETVLNADVDGNGVNDIIAAGGFSSEIVWYEHLRPAAAGGAGCRGALWADVAVGEED